MTKGLLIDGAKKRRSARELLEDNGIARSFSDGEIT